MPNRLHVSIAQVEHALIRSRGKEFSAEETREAINLVYHLMSYLHIKSVEVSGEGRIDIEYETPGKPIIAT